jgi:hypothetical protein
LSKFPRIILVFASVDWSIFMRKKMLFGLAEAAQEYDSTVIALNRPLCPFTTIFRKPHRMQEFFDKPLIEKKADNLYLFSPRCFITDGISSRLSFLENYNIKSMRKSYQYISSALNLDEPEPIVWYYHPQQGYLTQLFSENITILEIKDNLTDFAGDEIESVNKLEQIQRKSIDLLLATSPKLLEKYGLSYSEAWLSGNGLHRETYDSLTDRKISSLPEITCIPSPRIGYTGNISDRLDWKLIRSLIEKKPDWNFIFVGNITSTVPMQEMSRFSNIHFMGAYDHSYMPSVLNSFDLGMMPYKDNDFFRYSNPLKFYEFAAAGLRSVSSNMEVLNKFDPDFVKIVHNEPDAWINTITNMLSIDKNSAKTTGAKIASEFIWGDMCRKLLRKIDEKFFRG